MKHAVSFLTTALSITFFASTVFAQTMPPSEYDYSGEPNHYSSPANTPVGVISPSRPLITTDGGISDYGGFVFDFSKDADLKVATFMGVSFGVLPGIEFGVDIALLLKPFWTDVLFASVRLYGRYLLLEDLLAVELALYPALQGRLGVEVLTPVRVEIDKLLIFGQAKLQLWPDGQIESGNHYRAISSAAVLYEVADKIHALVNLGFSFESIG
ncbi:hypothetical protein KAI87_08820, partial [Myxococcota bacterium]|nr:hypothetical protein [Myxococcota bacterium]